MSQPYQPDEPDEFTADQPVAGTAGNIMGRKQPQDIPHPVEERYRKLFETINTGFCLCEAIRDDAGKMTDYRLIQLNPAFGRLTGLDTQELIGKTILEVMPSLDHWWFDTYQCVVDTRQTIRFEKFLPELGYWYDLTAFYYEGQQFAVYYDDITKRKRAEEWQTYLLTLSDALRPLTDPVSVQIKASNLLGKQLGANRVLYIEVESDGDTCLIRRDYVDGVFSVAGRHSLSTYEAPARQQWLAGQTVSYDDVETDESLSADQRTAITAAQVRAWVGVPLLKGGRLVAILAVHQATPRSWLTNELGLIKETAERIWTRLEHARAEEALRESEEKFRLLGIASSDSIYRMNPDWTQMHHLIGKTFLADTNDTNSSWLDGYIPPGDQSQVQQVLQEAIRTKTTFELEHRVLLADGTIGWTFSRAIPMLDKQGAIQEWLGAASDITVRKQAEETLRQADQRKDEFLAMLAHELRNPMSTIRSGLQILTLTDGTDEMSRATLAMMDRQTDHLVRMVDDLLDVSRISQGKIELKKQRVNLVELIAQASESVQDLYQQQGRRLQVELPTAPIYVEGDIARLSQVVTNLLTNGARYTGESGQVWLSLALQDSRNVPAGPPSRGPHPSPAFDGPSGDQEALIQVQDNGIGLGADQLATIFDLFVQVDNSVARSKGGLGLGLTLVKRLVELHGGRVVAQSAGIGKGSTFRVHLPTLHADTERISNPAEDSTVGTPTQRILVIDDNADAALTLSMLLKLKGYEVYTRHSGQAGTEAAESLQPTVILLDIGMPVLDGYATCRLIRQQPWGQKMVVIALTGYGQEEDRQRTQAAGFDGHLVKPLDLAVLTTLLTDLFDTGRANA